MMVRFGYTSMGETLLLLLLLPMLVTMLHVLPSILLKLHWRQQNSRRRN
jgi:hypothetical protein